MKKIALLLLVIIVCMAGVKAADQMPVLTLQFAEANLNYYTYTNGSMKLEEPDGKVTELPAKFKTRGATALAYPIKPSLNMKLETPEGEELDTDLLDIRTTSSYILDAMAIDRICMRNRVCFDIWNSFSRLPYKTDFDKRNGTKGRFVIVYINKEYKGIYCLSDKINRKLLDLKKPKEEDDGTVTIRGVLYKQGTTDIEDQNNVGFFNDSLVYVAAWHDAWELKEPDKYPSKAAWEPLINYYENESSQQFLIDNFYTDNLVDYSLLVMALCITDNWGLKNKYFSMVNWLGDDDDRRFIVTPWDLDSSLGGNWDGNYYNGNFSTWGMEEIANSALNPFSLCFANPTVKEAMRTRWLELRNTAFAVENVSKRLDDYCNLFVESGAWKEYVDFWNKRPFRPCYVDDLGKEISLIEEWYAERFKKMDDYFEVGTSALEDVTADNEGEGNGFIYDLNGRIVTVNSMIPGHIYIRNGKKFLHKGN